MDWNKLKEAYKFKNLDSETMDLIADCSASTKLCAKVLFPDYFESPFSKLADQIFDVLDDENERRVVIAAPRGFGKTSIVMIPYAARRILYMMKRFIVPVSNSLTLAEMQSENLKQALVTNPLIHKIFGNVRMGKVDKDETTETFSKKAWVANGYTIVLPRGSFQQVRGLLFRGRRPDEIIVDDLEDTETIDNEEVRKKRRRWFYGDLLQCFSKYDKSGRIIYIDTLKHEDSQLADLKDKKGWTTVWLQGCDENFKSLAPEYMTDEEIAAMVEEYRASGIMDVFYREIMNIPINPEDAMFNKKYYKYYSEEENNLNNDPNVETYILADFAKTVNKQSAESAVVGVGLDMINNKIYIRDIVNGKFHPDELYDEIFWMAERLQATTIAPETNGLEDYIIYPLKNEMLRRGKVYEIFPIRAVGKKEERASWLVPLYRKGLIFHNSNGCCEVLESQQSTCPYNKYWDVLDATAHLTKLLNKGERYMFRQKDKALPPPGVTFDDWKTREEEPDEMDDDEYADIYDEPVVKADWRWA